MAIRISQSSEPARFANPQIVHTKTPDGKELVVLSGVALVNKKGTGQQWAHDKLQVSLSLGRVVPRGKALAIEQHAALLTLNAAFNQNVSNNAGYAVDSSYVLAGRHGLVAVGEVVIEGEIAVRDVDGWLLRAGYYVTLVGHIVDDPTPPID